MLRSSAGGATKLCTPNMLATKLATLLCSYSLHQAMALRQSISLDGVDWWLALDPRDAATARMKANGSKVAGPVVVPGAWNAQGFGEDTTTVHHHYSGVGTYNHSVDVPASFIGGGKSLWIVAERIERSAKLTVNDKFVGEHTGYLSKMELDISDHAVAQQQLQLSFAVNATRNVGYDGLVGCNDLVMDNSGIGGWGGLGGHVTLESRDVAWMADPHVQHTIDTSTFNSATVNVSVAIKTASAANRDRSTLIGDLTLRVTYADAANKTLTDARVSCAPGAPSCTVPDITLQKPPLWSPSFPTQLTAVVELLDTQGTVLDHMAIKFGLKHVDLRGPHPKLNGKYLYMFGYGDDSIYPDAMSEPVNKKVYTKRLAQIKMLGYNFVRHHSHILPMEYFDAACEAGMLVSAEFPLGYGGAQETCPGVTCDAMLQHEWVSIIKQLRNHVCVFDYTMDNEHIGLHFAKDWYAVAKQLDPSRPVNTADGVVAEGALGNPVDFRSGYFAIQNIPIGDPHIFAVKTEPTQPVIVHEFGNFVSWPMLNEQIETFAKHDGIKPYWLTPARDKMQAIRLLDENRMWTDRSNALFIYCWKSKVEAVRKTDRLSGYEWWLVNDYWEGSNGIFDAYFEPKFSSDDMKKIANMHSSATLLVAEPGDNLNITADDTPRLLKQYTSKETLATSIYVSNYGDSDISGGTIEWKVVSNNSAGMVATVCSKSFRISLVKQGPGTTRMAIVSCVLPDLGTFQKMPQRPLSLSLQATLKDEEGGEIAFNEWRSRVFAAYEDGPTPGSTPVYTSTKYLNSLPFSNLRTLPPAGSAVEKGSVFVLDHLDLDVMKLAAEGGVVLVLDGPSKANNINGMGMETQPARFKTAWWLGSATDNNMGTVVYSDRWKGLFEGMAPEGWADEGWFRLIEGGTNYILDAVPGGVEVLLRSIDLTTQARNKALIWQAGFVSETATSNSSGAVVVCGLKLLVNSFSSGSRPVEYPEAAWLLFNMIDTAIKAPPQPETKLQLKITQCPGCIPSENLNLCAVNATQGATQAAVPINSVADVARATGGTEAEIVALSSSERTELMRDELHLPVLARKRIAAEAQEMREARV